MNSSKIDEIIDEIDEVLDKATRVPFGGGRSLVDLDRLDELFNDLRLNLPHELKEAKLVAFDKDSILNEARATAESIISQAEKRSVSICSESAIVKASKEMAHDLLKKAQNNANEIKRAANEYVDNLMNNTEKFMALMLQDVKKQKQSIRENRK